MVVSGKVAPIARAARIAMTSTNPEARAFFFISVNARSADCPSTAIARLQSRRRCSRCQGGITAEVQRSRSSQERRRLSQCFAEVDAEPRLEGKNQSDCSWRWRVVVNLRRRQLLWSGGDAPVVGA